MTGVPLFHVAQPGLLTTLQDRGRVGHQHEGMSVAGAMDPFAAQAANLLVGNARGEAVLEMTLQGPALDVLADVVIAVCGANLSATAGGAPLPLWKSVVVRAGQQVTFGRRRHGARAYLAVAGGFDVPRVLGSRSTFLRAGVGGCAGRALQHGDILLGRPREAVSGRALAEPPAYGGTVRLVLGPHADRFTPEGVETFLSNPYALTPQSDRMGCRLSGPPIAHASGADVLSEATPFGAVQVPADGQPIILMADRQTTGGYTQIATVISMDLPHVAQLVPGDSVSFQAVTVDEAQELAVQQERLLRLWDLING